MPDAITATATPSTFKAHPDGQYVGQCVDCINLGEKLQDFPGTKFYLAQTCALVFRTGEINDDTGEYIDIAREFTVSMGEKANLRKFLEQWRGKPYTAEQVEAGVPLDKLTGNYGLLSVAHRVSGKGRTYANITACVGVPKQMTGAVTDYTRDYRRADYWETRKAEYAEAAADFRAQQAKAQGSAEGFVDFPHALKDEADDLPF